MTNQHDNLVVDYHFYASCHGMSICDAMGAQAQRTIKNYEINTKAEVCTSSELAKVLQRTKNHHAKVAPTPFDPIGKVATRKGLKSWHRVRYRKGEMIAWRASTDEAQGIPPLGQFEEGKMNRSLILTADAKAERRKRKRKEEPLPHADTSSLQARAKEVEKKKLWHELI